MKKKLITFYATLIVIAGANNLLCRDHIKPKEETMQQVYDKAKPELEKNIFQYRRYLKKVAKRKLQPAERKRAKQEEEKLKMFACVNSTLKNCGQGIRKAAEDLLEDLYKEYFYNPPISTEDTIFNFGNNVSTQPQSGSQPGPGAGPPPNQIHSSNDPAAKKCTKTK